LTGCVICKLLANLVRGIIGSSRNRVTQALGCTVMKALWTGGVVVIAAVGLGVFLLGGRGAGPGNGTSAETIAVGQAIYAENCAACHGADLEGQPNWQTPLASGRLPAPPHDASGHTWHHPDQVLFEITKHGPAAVVGSGYESDMPGFEGILSDDQIRAVLAYIKHTWPQRERAFQEDRTRARQSQD
jgi:mono/diheme cytochrome c family protein